MNLCRLYLSLSLLSLLMTACVPASTAGETPAFDPRGEWTYTMTASDGNTYDAGTITFSGEPGQGTYKQVNFYQVEYEGTFTVNGSELALTGDETWQGTVVDANNLSGTWSHTDGASGTFSAQRK